MQNNKCDSKAAKGDGQSAHTSRSRPTVCILYQQSKLYSLKQTDPPEPHTLVQALTALSLATGLFQWELANNYVFDMINNI